MRRGFGSDLPLRERLRIRREQRQTSQRLLKELFGLSAYRPGQKAAVSCLLRGRDLLCILPTGAGKSLCWQLPAVMMEDELTVVVSPLLALMHDQVRSLARRGVPATSLDSQMTPEERREAERAILAGEIRIVFVSPERLETQSFQQLCQRCMPWMVVVDEAHCVVQWGEEFRPSYQRIGVFLQQLKYAPVICALTATADPKMQREIVLSLGMEEHRRIELPVLRENLRYHVHSTTDPTAVVQHIALRTTGKMVVFCRSRARTEQLAQRLRGAGLEAEHYHAGLDREGRNGVEGRFRSGQTRILAATTAFGMGVDIPDIRCVVHERLPDDVIDLVQQSGRAGRDGAPSDCYILIDPADLLRRSRHLTAVYQAMEKQPVKQRAAMRTEWLPLRTLLRVVMTKKCVAAGIAAAFGQRAKRCGQCSACRKGPLAKRVPDLPRRSFEDRRLWLMTWHRDALARRRGVKPETLIPRRVLKEAAEHMSALPVADAEANRMLQRLLAAIRQAEEGLRT